MGTQYILEGGIHDTYIWLQKHKAPENKFKDYHFSNNEKKNRGISHTSYQSIFKNFHGIAIAYELEIILVSSINVC